MASEVFKCNVSIWWLKFRFAKVRMFLHSLTHHHHPHSASSKNNQKLNLRWKAATSRIRSLEGLSKLGRRSLLFWPISLLEIIRLWEIFAALEEEVWPLGSLSTIEHQGHRNSIEVKCQSFSISYSYKPLHVNSKAKHWLSSSYTHTFYYTTTHCSHIYELSTRLEFLSAHFSFCKWLPFNSFNNLWLLCISINADKWIYKSTHLNYYNYACALAH